MSMYRPYSDVCFNNCYDFIMKSKTEKEVWELSTSLTFDDEEEMRWELDRISDLTRDIMNAEYDLCEMEMDALYDAMQYDSVFKENAFRTAKKANRRKQNKKNKSRDRIHGRRHSGAHGGVDFRYVDCNPFCNKHQYVDAMFAINGKHRHNADKKASAMSAREQDFLLNPSISEMKIEEEEKHMTEEENRILDNHYAVEDMLSNLKEGKYIFLLSFWNGERYPEDSIDCINRFMGIKTSEGVKDVILDEQRRHFHLPKMETETIHGFEGVSFKWDGYYEWDDKERGFIKFTFLYMN